MKTHCTLVAPNTIARNRNITKTLILSFALIFGILLSNNCKADDESLLDFNWPSASHDYYNSSNQLLEFLLGPATIKYFGLTKQFIGIVPSGMGGPPGGPGGGMGISRAGVTVVAPVIYNGIAYYADLSGIVYAVNILNGQLIFQTPSISSAIYFPGSPTAAFASTPVVTGNYLFIGDGASVLYKLNRFTGQVLGQVTTGQYVPTYDLNSVVPPSNSVVPFTINPYQVQGNIISVNRTDENKPPLIVFGLSSYTAEESAMTEDPTRGSIVGVNSATMQIEWQAFTTSNQNLTQNPRPRWGGSVSVWGSPAVDTGRHLIYIGTGNFHTPAPPLFKGSPTDNTPDYSDSLLAVNYDTGQIVGNVQLTRGDMDNACYSPGSTVCDPSTSPIQYLLNGVTPLIVNWSNMDPKGSLNSYTSYISNPKDILGRPIGQYQQFSDDIGSAPQLFTIQVNGTSHDVVGVVQKDGTYFVFDRDNLNKLYWAQPSIAFQSGNDPFDLIDYGAGSIGGAAIDYLHNLLWETTTGDDANGNGISYVQAMDMNTGKIKAEILPAQFSPQESLNGSVVANNVLYLTGSNGYLYLFDISSCSSVCQPKLIYQDVVQNVTVGPFTLPLSINRNASVAYGKIYVAVGNFFGPPPGGGLVIYNLNLPF